MFLEDSDFEDEEPKAKSKSESKLNDKGAKESSQQKEMMMKMESFGNDDDPEILEDVSYDAQELDDNGFGSAGTLGVGSSSRARMLAQQRELQLKRRHAAIQSSGMIRSSADGAPGELAVQEDKKKDNKFTPAVRQFSAPKAVKDPSADISEQNSEFQGRNDPTVSRRVAGDDDGRKWRENRDVYYDDDRDRYQGRDRDRDRFNERERGWNNARYEDEDNDYDDYHGGQYSRRYEDDYDYDRRGRNGRTRDDRERRGRGDYEGRGDEWEDAGSRHESGRGNNYRNERNTREDRDAERERAKQRVSGAEPRRPYALNLSNKRQFLNSPIPKEAGIVQCYIRRDKSSSLKNPVYSLYLKEEDVFLLTSRNRTKINTSNYLISMAENDFDRQGPNYVGKLRSNLLGTEFQVFDDGYNPKDADDTGGGNGHNQNVRKSLAVVVYAANYMGYRGPRKMQVVIPSVDENGDISASIRPGEEDFLGRIRDKNFRDLVYMINKPPRWNDQVGAYVLNFNGRVTMASVKNFQLVDPEEQNVVILQFGRVGKDEFTMDLQWPMSPLQAFAITMSSFDSKFACD